MSEVRKPGLRFGRRDAVRAALAVAYVALGAVVFLTGRTHSVIIEYAAAADGSYPAVEQVTVFVGRNEGIEFMGGDFRDQAKVTGQRHRLVIEPFTGGEKIVKEFSIPVGVDVVLLSVPKAAAGIVPFVVPYVAPTRISTEDSNAQGNSFTSPGGTAENRVEVFTESPPVAPAP